MGNMGERTDELRDLFESVTGTTEVTERQRRPRGTLSADRETRAALAGEIEQMQGELAFEVDLSVPALTTLLEAFYDGQDDATIAETVTEAHDVALDGDTVARARLDLHLVRNDERPPSALDEDLAALSRGETEVESLTAAHDVAPETVERWLAVRETIAERRRVADRYRQAFESQLADRDLAERLTASLEETGLDGAVADQEVDLDM
jgi:hypothetical protein